MIAWLAGLASAGELTWEPQGFVDVGWFAVSGNGAGYRPYFGSPGEGATCPAEPPARDDLGGWLGCFGWVYLGDPWAAPVNSQGDPANLLDDDLQRPDRIDTRGPTFLVNAVEAGAEVTAGTLSADAALLIEPAAGHLGNAGDWFSLDRAWVSWQPVEELRLEAGKVESVFGTEWSDRRAPDRWNITPSLIARYTSGTPVGVAGHYAGAGPVTVDVSLTNGGTGTERFGEMHDDLDHNRVPTATARVGAALGSVVVVGVSGQAGAQDGRAEPIPMFQVGGDLSLHAGHLDLAAEYLVVRQDFGRFGTDDRLAANGGYVLAKFRIGQFYPLARLDRRLGTMEVVDYGVSHVYLGNVIRGTVGAAWMSADGHVSVKAEGLAVGEIGLPTAEGPFGFDDNVLTTSVVFSL